MKPFARNRGDRLGVVFADPSAELDIMVRR